MGGGRDLIQELIYIFKLDLSNITRRFAAVSGLSDEKLSDCSDHILAAKLFVERRISKIPEGEDISLLEYCAACYANYSYICALLSKPRKLVTSGGAFSESKSDSSLLEAAARLKAQAFSQAAHLLCDDGFVFTGV